MLRERREDDDREGRGRCAVPLEHQQRAVVYLPESRMRNPSWSLSMADRLYVALLWRCLNNSLVCVRVLAGL